MYWKKNWKSNRILRRVIPTKAKTIDYNTGRMTYDTDELMQP